MPRNLSRRIKVDRAGSSVNLSKERVLRAAVALADKGGIESLSMRKLGQDLGVEAMSLYNYVASKDDLLDSMADFIVGEFDLPSIGTEWKETLRQSAISAHQVLWRHPWACGLNVSRPKVGPAALRYMNSVMGSLRGANFSLQLTHDALHAIFSHIYGFTLQELGMRSSIESLDPETAAILLRQMDDEYPHINEVARGAIHDHEVEFAFVLDLIIDGLEHVRDNI
jgi:AcrR family transcriptional regulator